MWGQHLLTRTVQKLKQGWPEVRERAVALGAVAVIGAGIFGSILLIPALFILGIVTILVLVYQHARKQQVRDKHTRNNPYIRK